MTRVRVLRFAVVALLALAAVALVACTPTQKQPTPAATTTRPDAHPPDASADAALAIGEPVATINALAAHGATHAPLMREIARIPDATAPTDFAVPMDSCFRASVAASRPARVWFEDGSRVPRGDPSDAGAAPALVPPRGPACARAGETLRLVVEAEATSLVARAVVWRSP